MNEQLPPFRSWNGDGWDDDLGLRKWTFSLAEENRGKHPSFGVKTSAKAQTGESKILLSHRLAVQFLVLHPYISAGDQGHLTLRKTSVLRGEN